MDVTVAVPGDRVMTVEKARALLEIEQDLVRQMAERLVRRLLYPASRKMRERPWLEPLVCPRSYCS